MLRLASLLGPLGMRVLFRRALGAVGVAMGVARTSGFLDWCTVPAAKGRGLGGKDGDSVGWRFTTIFVSVAVNGAGSLGG